MSLNLTPSGERIQIAFFGCTNVGKSSLVNAITNQKMSIVSNINGTTTDVVRKSMEILPLGPVVIIDTPGIDDKSILGSARIEQTNKILQSCDIAILVTDAINDESCFNIFKTEEKVDKKEYLEKTLNTEEKRLIEVFENRQIPYIIVKNKIDLLGEEYHKWIKELVAKAYFKDIMFVSSSTIDGVEEVKTKIGNLIKTKEKDKKIVADLINPKDVIVLVMPIDSSAPKGRIILPQQQVLREILDTNAIAICVQPSELEEAIKIYNPKLVITDSQVFEEVNKIVPKNVLLTSFSILMARYKGFLKEAINGAKMIDSLEDGAHILISEGCTHHKQCEDIGTVKLPKMLKSYTNKDLMFTWTNGLEFPQDLENYKLVIHCGGCMLNANEILRRMNIAVNQNIPFTNYGITIAKVKGILERSIEIFE